MLKTTNLLNFSILLGVLGVALVAGRAFCGWMCPLGTLQDFLASWGRRLTGERKHIRGKASKALLPLHLPAIADKFLRYAKYLILALILVASLYAVYPPLHEFCPVRAVFSFKMTALLWSVLVAFVATSSSLSVPGASISARSAQRWRSSTRSRLSGSSATTIIAITADAVTSSARWALKTYPTT